MRPGAATSTAASIPSGTASMRETSSTTGTGLLNRFTTSTASSLPSTAAATWTPRPAAASRAAAVSSKSVADGTTTTTDDPGSDSPRSASAVVVPTPSPTPPGVRGSWPIIVDSVMIVSVIVSIASPLMTGVASLSRTVPTSATSRPARRSAASTAASTPATLSTVPLTPLVRLSEAPTCSAAPLSVTRAALASVVELPMSTPTTSPARGGAPGPPRSCTTWSGPASSTPAFTGPSRSRRSPRPAWHP